MQLHQVKLSATIIADAKAPPHPRFIVFSWWFAEDVKRIPDQITNLTTVRMVVILSITWETRVRELHFCRQYTCADTAKN